MKKMRTKKEFKEGDIFVLVKSINENAFLSRRKKMSIGSICILLNGINQTELGSNPFFSKLFCNNGVFFSIISDEIEDYLEPL